MLKLDYSVSPVSQYKYDRLVVEHESSSVWRELMCVLALMLAELVWCWPHTGEVHVQMD